VALWSCETLGQPVLLGEYVGHASCISCVAVSGNRVVSGSEDGSILVWALEE
ncbi:hypothetical protein KIPB_005405, partial [Kipferlia bialata]